MYHVLNFIPLLMKHLYCCDLVVTASFVGTGCTARRCGWLLGRRGCSITYHYPLNPSKVHSSTLVVWVLTVQACLKFKSCVKIWQFQMLTHISTDDATPDPLFNVIALERYFKITNSTIFCFVKTFLFFCRKGRDCTTDRIVCTCHGR